ncbi:MAG: diaminopimelate epimerase, partial [Prevotellaceae bacterium]|nr:diaminopimelate epimerase [Prevotellaceae bacterium]
MKFTKMHGIGNDYIYVNGFVETIDNPAAWSIKYSDRHKGIGADGLVLILPSEVADFRMRMFNADGSEAEMCGNASRCVGKYVYEKALTRKTTLTLETLAGIRTLVLHLNEETGKVDTVTVDMGEPILDSAKIPTTFDQSPVIDKNVKFSDTITYNITCVSMGNPHAVIFTENISTLDLPKIGTVIENATQYFPKRINTEFIDPVSHNRMKMRVWERGSGETMACGTGASAAVVAGVLNGKCARKTTVELLG